MALTTVSTIISKLDWQQTITQNGQTQTDSGSILLPFTLSSGTGTRQVNGVWSDTRTLSSGGTDSLDLSALVRNVLGGSYNVNFTNIKAFTIKNNDTVAGFTFSLKVTGDGFGEPFGYPTGTLEIPPSSALIRMNPYDGWTVPSGSKLYLHDGGSGCSYNIAIVGVTG